MEQLTIDFYLEEQPVVKPELISFNESSVGFHWVRITKGFVPGEFKRLVYMEDNNGYSQIHTGTKLRDQIIQVFTSQFDGEVSITDWFSE